MVRSLSILFLGDEGRTEFRDARACLDRWGAVRAAADVHAAAAILSDHDFAADVIVIAQAFPGQFSHLAVDRLRRAAPLARVLGLMGSWCEGEMRTGSPWPGVVRTYWHQWTARCARELRQLAEGQCASWALPVTATEEERLLVDAAMPQPHGQGLIVIDTPSSEMYGWLSAVVRSRGYSTVWQRRSASARMVPVCIEGAAAAIFDGDSRIGVAPGAGDDAAFRRLVAQLRPAPVIALLDFPRIEDRRRILAAGAAAVLSKPLAIEDLDKAIFSTDEMATA